MERNLERGKLSRRTFIAACIGGVATFGRAETVASPARNLETRGGGVLCSAPPTARGTLELEAVHDRMLGNNSRADRYEVAAKYGLTLIPRIELQDFVNDQLLKAGNPQEATAYLSSFIEHRLGFPISIGTAVEDADSRFGGNPSTIAANEAWLLKYISMLPKEFYSAVRLTSLKIENLIPVAAGYYDLSSGEIALDPVYMARANTVYHEIGHAANMTSCGRQEDKAIIDTLPPGITYTTDWQDRTPPTDVFVESYGQENDKEDVATITAAWITNQIGLSIDLRGTPIYEKLAIIMDRFDTLAPGIVQYIEEGVRPSFD